MDLLEMITYEETGTLPERPGKEEVRDMMLRHARLQLKYKGEFIGIREMRKTCGMVYKGLKGSAKLREEINRVESYQELEELLFQRLWKRMQDFGKQLENRMEKAE